MKVYKSVCCVIFFVLLGCKGKNDISQSGVCTIDVDITENMMRIGETGTKFFDSCRCIQLETDTSGMIGDFDRLVFTQDRIYILDTFKAQSVFIFDQKGNYINKINKTGNGPDEYSRVFNIFYDNLEQTINLVDLQGKILSFDKDGREVKSINKFSLNLFEAQRNKEGLYVLNSNNFLSEGNHRVSVFSSTRQKMYSCFPVDPHMAFNVRRSKIELFSCAGEVLYSPGYTNDVYKITSDSAQHLYHYNFGKYTYPDEYKVSRPPANVDYEYVTDIRMFMETDKKIFATFLFHGQYRMNIYDKKQQVSETYFLLDNPVISVIGFGDMVAITDEYVITQKSPSSFIDLFNNEELNAKERKEMEMLKKQFVRPLNEDDNPILCLYRIRK